MWIEKNENFNFLLMNLYISVADVRKAISAPALAYPLADLQINVSRECLMEIPKLAVCTFDSLPMAFGWSVIKRHVMEWY